MISPYELDEVQYHIQAANFCNKLPQPLQEEYAKLNGLMDSCYRKRLNVKSTDCMKPFQVLSSYQDIRKYYLENKNAIKNNIPRPRVFEYDNHAVVSLKDIISHVLGHNLSLNGFTCNDNNPYHNNLLDLNPDINQMEEFINTKQEVSSLPNSNNTPPLILLEAGRDQEPTVFK